MVLYDAYGALFPRVTSFLRRLKAGIDRIEPAPSGTGYECVYRHINRSFKLTLNPDEGDLELFLGYPNLKLKQEVSPSLILTMFETDLMLKPDAIEQLKSWDAVLVPSRYCREVLKSYEIESEYIPLGCPDGLKFQERKLEPWTFYTECTSFGDRKNSPLVFRCFQKVKEKMPDARLVVKSLGIGGEFELETGSVRAINRYVTKSERLQLLKEAQVSVYPSGGEGFGLMPLEHMRTGMCVIAPSVTGLSEFISEDTALVLQDWTLRGPFYRFSEDEVCEKMLWTYEHREEALELGRRASKAVRHLTMLRFLKRFRVLLERLVKSIPRRRLYQFDGEQCDEWFDLQEVLEGEISGY